MQRLRRCLLIGLVPAAILLTVGETLAQPHGLDFDGAATTITDIGRPRLAYAGDGAFAVAVNLLSQEEDESQQVAKIAVRRFSPTGAPVGPWHLFRGESCSGVDMWLFDYTTHAELAFRPDGILVVVMEHEGRYVIGSDDVASAEVTIGAVDPSGQRIDLNGSGTCTQRKLVFVGAGRQDRPRLAMAPSGGMLVTADGFFDGSDLRNAAIRVLDSDLNTLFEQGIPHSDPQSQQAFHVFSDIVTNGTIALSVWQRCPIIDPQGNAAECDIGAQFIGSPISQAPSTLGGNVPVTSGDPAGTISVWPAAAMNASGGSVVVWADSRTSLTGDVFGQRFDASGQALGTNFQISTGQGAVYDRPEVAMLEDGGFAVAWTDSSSLGFQARGRRYDGTGQPLGSPFRFTEEAGIQSGYPTVTVAGSAIEAAWLAGRTGEVPGVYTGTLGIVTSDEPQAGRSTEATLLPIYPNPFQTSTRLSFELPEASDVTLVVVDVLGRVVTRLVEGRRPAGRHEAVFDPSRLPSGTYLVRLTTGGGFVQTQRVTLMR